MNETTEVTTTNFEEIKKWAREHHALPAIVGDLDEDIEQIGLRFDFPGNYDEMLLNQNETNQDVTWDRFFKIFEKKNLIFAYYPNVDDGDPTRLYRFIPS